MDTSPPITVALAEECALVACGFAPMLASFAHRVTPVPVRPPGQDTVDADVVLHDPYAAGPGASNPSYLSAQLRAWYPRARQVVYSWSSEHQDVARALRDGAEGFLAKSLPPAELVAALEQIARGHCVVRTAYSTGEGTDGRPGPASGPTAGLVGATADGAGRGTPRRTQGLGLTTRQAEVIGLVASGLSNEEIAGRMFVSINTIKSYIREAYRTMDVTSRSQAVLWALEHGLGALPGERREAVAREAVGTASTVH